MITLATIKDELGIQSGDTEDDSFLKRCLRQVIGVARLQTNRYLHCATDEYAVASDVATVRAIGHGVKVGDTIRLVNTGTNLDGTHEVTAAARDTVSFAFTSALSGTAAEGSLHPRRQVTFAGNGTNQQWMPARGTPFHSLVAVEYLEGDTWTAQTIGNYSTSGDALGRAVLLESSDKVFPYLTNKLYPAMGQWSQSPSHNIRLTLDVGAERIPDELEMCVVGMVNELVMRQGAGKDASLSLAGTTIKSPTGSEQWENRFSPDRVLLSWRA